MLSNYLKIACKVFLRRKFFTFISLFAVSATLVMLMVGAAIFDHVFGPSTQRRDSARGHPELLRILRALNVSAHTPNRLAAVTSIGAIALRENQIANLIEVLWRMRDF